VTFCTAAFVLQELSEDELVQVLTQPRNALTKHVYGL
jgi:ATP-dependent protease Clp ATPase subunit